MTYLLAKISNKNAIIAAFAGTGKTTLQALYPCNAEDFVCMPYKYHLTPSGGNCESDKGNPEYVLRDNWPQNYAKSIKVALCGRKTLLIPSACDVLALLRQEGLPYTLCYPRRDAKETYRQRFIARGNTEDFLSIFIDGWDMFINNLEEIEAERRIVLEPHQFLSDVISFEE
jgi:hypothetical protein